MKRRLPTIRKGESLLAAISLPPLTDDANRHAPSRSHPGSPAAASNAAPIAASANRPACAGRADRLPAQLHRQRRERHAQLPGAARNRRTQPRAVVCGTPGRAAAGRTPHPRPATSAITAPIVSAVSSRQASTNAGSSAWLTPHGAHRTLGTKIFRQRPPAASRPDMPPVTGPERQRPAAQRAIRAGDLHLPASRHIRIDRQRARPYDGHGRLTASDPSPRSASNEARRDPSRSAKTGKSWPAQRQPGGDIVKEHGQTRGRDAQEVKPSTPGTTFRPGM